MVVEAFNAGHASDTILHFEAPTWHFQSAFKKNAHHF